MSAKDGSYFVTVDANGGELTKTWEVPDGVTWLITDFVGAAAGGASETVACLVWDYGGSEDRIVRCTHGDLVDRSVVDSVTGSEVSPGVLRTLSIVLRNDSAAAHPLGASWLGKVAE